MFYDEKECQEVIDDLRNARGSCVNKIWLDGYMINTPIEASSGSRLNAMKGGEVLHIDELFYKLYRSYCT